MRLRPYGLFFLIQMLCKTEMDGKLINEAKRYAPKRYKAKCFATKRFALGCNEAKCFARISHGHITIGEYL